MALSARRPSQSDAMRQRMLKEVTNSSEKKRRLNAEIEDSLYRRIKMQAAQEGRSISDITRELWIEYLSKHSNE
jgi:hypothetical protein